jgi:rhodanese-related sulfurtransferase
MTKMRFLVSLITLLAAFSYAWGQNFRTITAEELKQMVDAKKNMVIVDARPEAEYRQGHISKAVNIPPEKLNRIGALLPKNKKVTVIFYCKGVG